MYTSISSHSLPRFLRDGDQWLFAQSGARIVAGQLPYQDFWEMLTPGTDLVYACSFMLFGQRFVVANILFLLIALVICRNVDESCRGVGYQRLEAEAFFHLGGELRIGTGDHTLPRKSSGKSYRAT